MVHHMVLSFHKYPAHQIYLWQVAIGTGSPSLGSVLIVNFPYLYQALHLQILAGNEILMWYKPTLWHAVGYITNTIFSTLDCIPYITWGNQRVRDGHICQYGCIYLIRSHRFWKPLVLKAKKSQRTVDICLSCLTNCTRKKIPSKSDQIHFMFGWLDNVHFKTPYSKSFSSINDIHYLECN